MKNENGQFLFSATDLTNHLGCVYATQLDRQYVEGAIELEYHADPLLELLIELGNRHEQAYLEHLQQQNKSVVKLDEFGGKAGSEKAIEAMKQGVDVIAQATFVSLPWRGRTDFLFKVDRPSKFGAWSYEVADTKLTHTTKSTAVLQLCLYSELLAEIQGVLPERMFVVKPGRPSNEQPFDIDTLRVADYMAYYRMAKSRFEKSIAEPLNPDVYPEPCSHCQICNWWPRCNQSWRSDDHLSFVAGITKSQRSELAQHGVTTLEAFADLEKPLPQYPKRGSLKSFEKSHRQAKIQLKGRRSGTPEYEFNDVEHDRGFLRLPEPDTGDVFFDIEGNPRAFGEGLEYLFGYVTHAGDGPAFSKLWALNKRDEKKLFETFIDFAIGRWSQYPNMHIYHFAPYEPAALKRLANRHATRENELDELLRGKRFVDLYAITKQSIRASVESYSIKQLEQFYGYQRLEVLAEASKALREVERLIEFDMTGDLTDRHRSTVETYNKDDCLSTLALRDWLESLRATLIATGVELERPIPGEGDPSETIAQMSEEVQSVFDRLTADIADDEPKGECQESRWLLAHMLEYFRREDKCNWWEYFRMHDLEHEELLRDRKGLAGLKFQSKIPPPPRARTEIHRYSFEPQEFAIGDKDEIIEVSGEKLGSLSAIDLVNCTIDIKKRGDSNEIHPTAIFAFSRVGPDPMPQSILDFGNTVADSIGNEDSLRSARYDLLVRRPPRLKTLSLPLAGENPELAIQIVTDMDDTTLAIQGPPGAGKTFIGSKLIIELAKQGKRIGVTAVSHKVILNMLESVHDELPAGEQIALAHQTNDPGDDYPEYVTRSRSKGDSLELLNQHFVLGGTAWLWSDELMEQQLDYLFIDEAGQMSLAMAIAAGRAAKNIILLGDPQQLEQPQQGTHPVDSGIAALAHVLNGLQTMPVDRGLFLDDTWRLHPAICEFTSEQYYDGRLASIADLEHQVVHGNSSYTGFGLRYIRVEHEGNQNRSDEEVAVVVDIYNQLIDGSHQWRNKDGESLKLTMDDVLVVAPYNAQVSSLIDALPTGARVGTVDKFQGQEAPIVIYSMASSSASDAPRGMSFLFSRNRTNVATSRARCLVLLVGSPSLFEPDCETPEQMKLANGFCRYLEMTTRSRHSSK